MRGSVLHPLNRLRDLHPDVYGAEVAKYRGREELMGWEIPPLNLRWNDVLHCAPVDPHLIYAALRECGREYQDRSFFAIPVERLRGYPVAILFPEEQYRFETFDEARYREIQRLPARMFSYFSEELRAGRRPLIFAWVPHVLVGASISVEGLEEVAWSRPARG